MNSDAGALWLETADKERERERKTDRQREPERERERELLISWGFAKPSDVNRSLL
jgi:hypothetical protein